MARHVMTARRRAALRKAQMASARKRRGKKRTPAQINRRNKRIATGLYVGTYAAVYGGLFYALTTPADRKAAKNLVKNKTSRSVRSVRNFNTNRKFKKIMVANNMHREAW